jgi:1-acyl-sn-glycerol-3-phosphate acyltransferase
LPAPIFYAVVCSLARVLLGFFYESVDVMGPERVPPAGPLIVAGFVR